LKESPKGKEKKRKKEKKNILDALIAHHDRHRVPVVEERPRHGGDRVPRHAGQNKVLRNHKQSAPHFADLLLLEICVGIVGKMMKMMMMMISKGDVSDAIGIQSISTKKKKKKKKENATPALEIVQIR
jgi:hypothetical protein